MASRVVLLCCCASSVCLSLQPVLAAEERTENAVPYRTDADLTDLAKKRCRLDIVHPVGGRDLPTVIWFHGGGLTQGERQIPDAFRGKNMVLVGPTYRLSPQVKVAAIVDDAATAVAWTFKNIEKYGGSPRKIYLTGHSAGGYLSLIVSLDKKKLGDHGIDANQLAGVAAYSGQTITHFVSRRERGMPDTKPMVDEFAPLFHVRKDAPPLLLITGDREREMLGRYEENAYLWRMMKVVGQGQTTLHELPGTDHDGMVAPAHPIFLEWLQKQIAK